MRELLDQGVDPDDFEAEDAEYDSGMTDEQLDEAHADMGEFLQDSAPVEGIIGGAAFGLIAEFAEETDQLRNERDSLSRQVAALQAQCESYAAELIGERGENAKLRAWAMKVGKAWINGEGDKMNRLLENMPHQAITNTPD